MVKKISMDVDNILEFDYQVEEISDNVVDVNKNAGAISESYYSTDTYVFDPQSTGSYELDINGQIIEIEVTDIPDSVLEQDLLAWYRFEDGDARDYTARLSSTFADSTAYDGTVNGATFESSGGVTDFETGADSAKFNFDGSNDTITNIYNGSVSSICYWANTDEDFTGNDVRDTVIGIDSTILTSFGSLTRDFDGETVGILVDSSRSLVTNTITQGEWNHYAFAYDTSVNGNFRIHINGTQQSIDYNDGDLSKPDGQYTLGNRVTESEYYDGQLDDVRFYDKSLTPTEISNIYNATKP